MYGQSVEGDSGSSKGRELDYYKVAFPVASTQSLALKMDTKKIIDANSSP